MRRLDELHVALTRYFDGKLSLAPIDATDIPPRKILDLGCGSGAWAIQAAIEFPAAEVLAIDISPLPNRNIPANMSFKLQDLSKELDIEKHTFDIVHARFVMIPDGESAVKRAAELVKPGGVLILEDLDISPMLQTGGHAVQHHTSRILELFRSRKADAELGRRLAGIMTSTGYFPNVQVRRLSVPLSGKGGANTTENEFGLAFKKTWVQGAEAVGKRAIPNGPTEDMLKRLKEELESTGCQAVSDVYFCWARRALE
ncbi:S-adenosyl-L-methionine-dependent methyltransferase [Mycena capillaripes]|nr:S-adenosyl-L-methionine-dependent methyltransferase [Mycena capillaripes]